MRQIILIIHDIRSTHNIGSLLRTAEGLGVTSVIFSGYSPHPQTSTGRFLPHLAQKIDKQIAKTALGAENLVPWEYSEDVASSINELSKKGFLVVALEQSASAVALPDFVPPDKLVIILGREVEGIDVDLLKLCDQVVEIPMFGKKESFNVVQAAAMMLYHCQFPGKS
jgi:23S rRNA (guanosine2251-2'-O)-methyltransferase